MVFPSILFFFLRCCLFVVVVCVRCFSVFVVVFVFGFFHARTGAAREDGTRKSYLRVIVVLGIFLVLFFAFVCFCSLLFVFFLSLFNKTLVNTSAASSICSFVET